MAFDGRGVTAGAGLGQQEAAQHLAPLHGAEVAVALGLVLQLQRRFARLDVDEASELNG